jgi:hypothetical protein
MDTTRYVEYLDKEMTIMGILSGVSLVAPAGILSAVLGDHSDVKIALWNTGQFFIVAGSALCVVASLCFYKQRSTLAWFYGQICFAEALEDKTTRSETLREWLTDADSWATWWPYGAAFAVLIAGFAEYLLALIFLLVPPHWYWLSTHSHPVKVIAFWACPVLAAGFAVLQWHVRTTYKFSESCWKEFFIAVRQKATP